MAAPQKIELKNLNDFIDAAIWHDFLIAILITSASEGILKNLGIDYGVGKCLAGETEVLTPKGQVELRKLHKGDKIVGVSENRLAIGEVTGVFRSTQRVLEVKTKTGTLYSGPEHRFLSLKGNWVQTSELSTNTLLTHVCGFYGRKTKKAGKIQRIDPASQREKLYDIATSTGNYFANNYLVHNSTLMLDLAFSFIDMWGQHFRVNPATTRDQKWDRTFEALHAFPYEVEEFFYKAPKRYPGEPVFFLLDDIQRVFGKSRSRDNYVRSLRDRATTARPQLAVFMATAPDIGELAYPWRYFFNFEVKVAERGYYEVQRLKKWTLFDNPYQTMVKLDYKGEVSRAVEAKLGQALSFPRLPSDIQDRYEEWRAEANKRFDEGEGEWRLRSILNVLTDEAKELLRDLIGHGSYEKQHIVTILRKGDELKLLLNCGLVEKFGDTVVPTKQARKMAKQMQ